MCCILVIEMTSLVNVQLFMNVVVNVFCFVQFGHIFFCYVGSVSDTEIRQLHWSSGRQPQISDRYVLRCPAVYLLIFIVCIVVRLVVDDVCNGRFITLCRPVVVLYMHAVFTENVLPLGRHFSKLMILLHRH